MASFSPWLSACVVHSDSGEVPRLAYKPHRIEGFLRGLKCIVTDNRVENHCDVWQRKVCAKIVKLSCG